VTTTSSEAAAPSTVDPEVAAVASVPGRLVAAWAAHDAEAVTDLFTADGTMILPGVFRKGVEDIRAFWTEAFEGHYRGTRVTGKPLDLRFLNSDTAIVVTVGGVLAPGDETVTDERAIRATWVVVKRDGGWKLAAYHNSPRDAA
jgi:uncharacterized protein (TIGR02246 family)